MKKLLEVDLHLTNQCNFNCIYCSYDSRVRDNNEISINRIIKFLNDINKMGVKEIHITGGEPFLRKEKDMISIIKTCVDLGYNVRIQTNGYLASVKRLEKLYDEQVRDIMISLDGSYKALNDKIRGFNGAFDQAIKAINNSIKIGYNVRVNSVVMNQNVQDMFKLVELTNKLGVSIHSLFYFSPIGRGKNLLNEWVIPQNWLEFIKKLEAFYSFKKIKSEVIVEVGYITQAQLKKWDLGCKIAKREYCILLSNGDIYPCVFFVNSHYSYGNIVTTDILDIWNKPDHWNSYNEFIYNKCCTTQIKCLGGCKGYSYIATGNPYKPDPRCTNNKQFIPICPIIKKNIRTLLTADSTIEVITK